MRYLLHDVFLDDLVQNKHKIAITEENGRNITYGQLNSLANQFATCYTQYKQNRDIKTAPFIGILSSVHINSIAAILGALKIGCAYIPLDEYSPRDRLHYILDNTQLDILVIDPTWAQYHAELFDHPALKKVIFLANEQNNFYHQKLITFDQVSQLYDLEPPLLNQVSDDLAYVLHSSGSTGAPKGIMLTHRNARTFVDWMAKEFSANCNDVIISRAPFKFDLSVFDIFNTFKAKARLVCFNWNRKRSSDIKHLDYVSLMVKEKVTILYTTPSTFITLMHHGKLNRTSNFLTQVMYAGEPFPIPQLKKLQETLPKTKIANIYGPTETNIITYYWIDKIPDDLNAIPLGQVVDDTEIIVVAEDQSHLCEPGEIGELWCRGGTTTIGYLGMPEKTNECLVTSQFHKYPCKFWRTGDFGYRDQQGILHYRGRRDHMVKVKGYRVEIGEIESALAKFSGLDEFAVVVKPHSDYGHELVCFVSMQPKIKYNQNELRDFLGTLIPSYMVPSLFINLKNLPHTSSGKIDRVLLQESLLNISIQEKFGAS